MSNIYLCEYIFQDYTCYIINMLSVIPYICLYMQIREHLYNNILKEIYISCKL